MSKDPLAEIERLIIEMREKSKQATAELISYKANEKTLNQQAEAHAAKAADWEKKAMAAVAAGDDALAKQALAEKGNCLAEVTKITRDRNEMAGIAKGLLEARREFEKKLKGLEIRKGTLATQIAAARTGGGTALGGSSPTFDKFKEIEDRLEDQAALDELDELTLKDQGLDEVKLREQTKRLAVEDELAALKARLGPRK